MGLEKHVHDTMSTYGLVAVFCWLLLLLYARGRHLRQTFPFFDGDQADYALDRYSFVRVTTNNREEALCKR